MEKDIGKIKKNEMTDIIVRIDDFGGKPGLTIREFATSEKYTGFTKSGTRIAAESFKAFKDIINSIDEKEFIVSQPAKKEEQTAGTECEDKEIIVVKKPEESRPKKSKRTEDMPKEELF